MKMTIKQVAAILIMLFTLIGGVYGVNQYFTPREITELYVAGLQQSQKEISLTQWIFYLNMEIDRLHRELTLRPNDARLTSELQRLKNERDAAQRELRQLMQK